MKRNLAMLLLVASWHSAFSQGGRVNFINTSDTLITTNALALGGTLGPTATDAGGFYYALFAGPVGITTVKPADLLSSTWTFTGLYATNRTQSGGAGRLATDGLVNQPATAGLQAGKTNSFVIAGWSSNLAGEDWGTVVSKFSGATLSSANGFWSGGSLSGADAGAFFGLSAVGTVTGGGIADDGNLWPSYPLFGIAEYPAPIDLVPGFDLYVVIPEPSAFTLAVIGFATLLGARSNRCRWALGRQV